MLATRVWEQDRALEEQRLQARLEIASNEVITQLQERYSQLLQRVARTSEIPADSVVSFLSSWSDSLASDGLILFWNDSDLIPFPPGRLLYVPAPVMIADSVPEDLREGENLEFQDKNFTDAAAYYSQFREAPDRRLRIGSLLGLGRALRNSQRTEDAIEVYDEIASLEDFSVQGIPVQLLALEAKATLLSEREVPSPDLETTLTDLLHGLYQARWSISRGIFEFYRYRADTLWTRAGFEDYSLPPDFDQRRHLSEVVIEIAGEREGNPLEQDRPGLSSRLLGQDVPFQVISSYLPAGCDLHLILGPDSLERLLIAPIEILRNGINYRLSLTTTDGRSIHGELPSGDYPYFMQPNTLSELPWHLYLEAIPPPEGTGLRSRQRTLFFAGLGLVFLLVLVSSFMLAASVHRHMQMARLESQFVSAVSHEFRSPLTSIRQIGEMLASGRVETAETRARYYQMLQQDTARLQRLVENFLDFGRAQAGARRYDLRPLDPVTLVEGIVNDFRSELADSKAEVSIEAKADSLLIKADRDAIERAVWNLLDNAIRYSPERKRIRVKIFPEREEICISVRDEGLGIEPDEIRTIFQRFSRGTAAERTGSRGTGIGLALVKHLIEAHGGTIEVESEPGQGSSFTIRLPREAVP
ncbi:ATP-binding protein [Gemmatimonadota bacterium]